MGCSRCKLDLQNSVHPAQQRKQGKMENPVNDHLLKLSSINLMFLGFIAYQKSSSKIICFFNKVG